MMVKKRKCPNNWSDTQRKITLSYAGYDRLLRDRIKQLGPDSSDRKRFKALMGHLPLNGPLRMSDLRARQKFADLVATEVRKLSEQPTDRSFYHLTLLADEGVMSDRSPKLCLKLLKQKAHRALRKVGIDGVFVVEVQPLINWPQKGEGRTLLAHVHALCWTRVGSEGDSLAFFKEALGVGKDERNLAWSCQFGARPIVVKKITERRGCPSYWAAYILKGLTDAKTRLPRKGHSILDGKSAFKLRSTTKALRPELAMRVYELHAQLGLFAMTGGVGEGAAVLGRCKNRVRLWDAERQKQWQTNGIKPIPPFDEHARAN
ncbi:MAG: hypothetical protein ABJF09_08865 [Qipengyuania citrea]|uniref:hypothetical protein n=1 Tax=Alphaproteobacteria TaxID=28211 RepID=UPI0032652B46